MSPTLRDYYRDLPLMRESHVALLDRMFELRDNLSWCSGAYVPLAEALDDALCLRDGAPEPVEFRLDVLPIYSPAVPAKMANAPPPLLLPTRNRYVPASSVRSMREQDIKLPASSSLDSRRLPFEVKSPSDVFGIRPRPQAPKNPLVWNT